MMILTPAEIAKYQRVTDSKCADCGLGCHDEGCIWTWITALLADREELVKQLSEALGTHSDRITDAVTSDYCAALRTRAEQAEAERDRLRKALEEIADCPDYPRCQHMPGCEEEYCIRRAAYVALNPKEATNA